VLTFDAATPADPWPACPPLDEKPIAAATGDAAWGDMHAFRIRSPHGADSFYAGLTGAPDGGKMTLLFEDAGGAVRTVGVKNEKPYELSAHDLSFGDTIRFKLRLERAGAAAITTPARILNGTAPAAPAGLSAADLGGGRARLAWRPVPGALSYNIKRAAAPGGPFQTAATGLPAAAAGAAPEYTDAGLADNQTYYYTVSAMNAYGESPASAAAAVGIINNAAPKITAQPLAQSTACGTQITLSVSSAGNGLLYQWLKDGVEIPGAGAATLTLAGAPSDGGVYRVRVTGPDGAALSEPAAVAITPAAGGPLAAPAGVAVDDAGLVYVADEENHAVHILTPPGSARVYINTFAGEPGAPGAADATGTLARFNRPLGLAARAGTLYVADSANGALRTVTTGREAGTLAAGLGGPAGVAGDTAGNIYTTDKTAHVIRKIAAGGGASAGAGLVIAGRLDSAGADDGSGTAARFNAPAGVAWAAGAGPSAAGILYIADTGNHVIRKVDLDDGARVTTLAGNAGVPGWADGAGDDVLFDRPEGIIADIDGTLYIADTGNSLIREIAPGGRVGTVAGGADAGALAGIAGFKDATGTGALFNRPRGVALGRGGELYIADTGNRAIRRIDLDNNVQTLLAIPAGSASGQNPGQPGSSGGGGGGGGGGALPAWYFIALSALLLSKTARRAAGF
jgi:sugar lactone lactonase YvrE